MKTLIVKLKLGVVLTVLILLASCGINSNLLTETGFNVIYCTLPSFSIRTEKSTLDKTQHTPVSKKEDKLHIEKTEPILKAMPITIGITEKARLVSSPV